MVDKIIDHAEKLSIIYGIDIFKALELAILDFKINFNVKG